MSLVLTPFPGNSSALNNGVMTNTPFFIYWHTNNGDGRDLEVPTNRANVTKIMLELN